MSEFFKHWKLKHWKLFRNWKLEIGNSQAGFTLVEILIAITIVSGVVIGLTAFIGYVQDASLRFSQSLTTQQQIQQTLQIMVPEIRSAAQSNIGAYPLATVSSTSLQFYSDIDADGLAELVHYYLDEDVFRKGVIKPSGDPLSYATSSLVVYDLVENMFLADPVFSYYADTVTSTASAPLASPVDILEVKMIRISLTANQGTQSSPSLVGVSDQVTIRNLRYK